MKKGTDTERREGSNNKPNRAREQGQKKFRSNAVFFFFKELSYDSFDFLLPDSP